MPDRVIFHVDMDAFFTSVEQRDNPAYRGKPVIVGAQPGKRGVVSAASYEARTFGVHSAMPINEAYSRCPHGIFLPPRMPAYSEASKKIMTLFEEFSPLIEPISVDEAFIDMTGTEKLFGSPRDAALQIKQRIKKDQQLTASVGIAPNKFLAKIASDLNKPDGITDAPFEPDKIIEWLAPMNVQKIWGVGKKSAEVLSRLGVSTVSDLQKLSQQYLHERFGASGAALYYLARGIDERAVENSDDVKSISREYTFNIDSRNPAEWKQTLFLLSQDIAQRARAHGVKGRTVVLSYRRPDFSRHSRRKPLPQPSNVARVIYESVVELLDQTKESSLRLIGVGITNLDQELQIDLFSATDKLELLEKTEETVDKLKARFGADIISKGLELGLKKRIDSDERLSKWKKK
jgi:DNA polymerase-4